MSAPGAAPTRPARPQREPPVVVHEPVNRIPAVVPGFIVAVHHCQMLFMPPLPTETPDGHVGYVGRYRDGAYSDIWTDVRRCSSRTFTAYAPACSCGWRAAPHPVTDIALIACRRIWTREQM